MARKKIIPKRIGTVRIPKRLRRAGDRVLTDPRAREVAAGALLAVATTLSARGAAKGATSRGASEAGGAKAASDVTGRVAEAVAQVLGEVVDAVRRDLGRAFRGKRAAPAAEAPEAGDDGDQDRVH